MTSKLPLSETHPELATQAFGWDPNTVTSGSGVKVQWKCGNNHSWSQVIRARTKSKNSICPDCNSFAFKFPLLAIEAHGWEPSKVSFGSKKVLNWKCHQGHIYEMMVQSRSKGYTCPICSNYQIQVGMNDLNTTHPNVAREADGWDPTSIVAGNSKDFSWRCQRNHTYIATPNNRTRNGSGCPYCAGSDAWPGFNDLATIEPEIAKQAFGWDPSKVTPGSGKKLDWKCEFGHIWNAQVSSRSRAGCPFCAGQRLIVGENDLLSKNKYVASQLRGVDPSTIMAHTNQKLEWECGEGHKWMAPASDRMAGQGCPSCAKFGYKTEQPGYLYFLTHKEWGMLQIGITNFPKVRISKHEKIGWKLVELRGPMDGLVAREWESSILQMLRRHGAKLAAVDVAGKFDGYTEAWLTKSFPAESLKELMQKVQADE